MNIITLMLQMKKRKAICKMSSVTWVRHMIQESQSQRLRDRWFSTRNRNSTS